MAGLRAKRKRKSYAADNLEISLSDLEDDYDILDVTYSVTKVTEDRRRVARERGMVEVKERTQAAEGEPGAMDDFFIDFGGIDVEAFRTEKDIQHRDGASVRRRYVSSVRTSCQLRSTAD